MAKIAWSGALDGELGFQFDSTMRGDVVGAPVRGDTVPLPFPHHAYHGRAEAEYAAHRQPGSRVVTLRRSEAPREGEEEQDQPTHAQPDGVLSRSRHRIDGLFSRTTLRALAAV